jgi:hypothetical protein
VVHCDQWLGHIAMVVVTSGLGDIAMVVVTSGLDTLL